MGLARFFPPGILSCLMCFAAAPEAFAQSSEGESVVLPGHFMFSLPEAFELDVAPIDTAVVAGEESLILNADSPQVMLVAAGTSEAAKTAGVLPEATFLMVPQVSEPGSFAELGADLGMSDQEIVDLDAQLRAGFVAEANAQGDMTVTEWDGTQVVNLGPIQAIRFRFSGVARGEKHVIVNVYMIQNNDTMYYLTLTALYEVFESWVPSFNSVLSSLAFRPR